MAIDPNSPEYMFGKIMAKLDSGDKKFEDMADQVKEVCDKMSKLPCEGQAERVKNVEGWQEKHDKRVEHHADNRLSYKQAVTVAVITGIIASAPYIVYLIGEAVKAAS